jgi:hypothetical protein
MGPQLPRQHSVKNLTVWTKIDNEKIVGFYFTIKKKYRLFLTIGQNVRTKNIFNP